MACGKVTAKFTSKRQSVKQFPAFTAIAVVVGSVLAPEPHTKLSYALLVTADPEASEEGGVDRHRG